MDGLVKLPGIGRKTANVVLGHAFGIAEGIAVDTHVLRVSNRLGIARGDDPIEVERAAHGPRPAASAGRARPTSSSSTAARSAIARRPRCGECPVFALCRWPTPQAFATGKPPRARAAPGRTSPRRRRRRPAGVGHRSCRTAAEAESDATETTEALGAKGRKATPRAEEAVNGGGGESPLESAG